VGPGGPVGPATQRARLVKYTVPFAVIVLMNQLVHSQTEVFFLGRLRGPQDAAYFQYGFVLAQRLVDFLPLALWEVSMAAFVREDVVGEKDLREVCHSYLRLSYSAILPVAAIGVVLSPALIALFYGEKMQASVMVAQAYFVLGAVAAFGAPMGMVLYAREATGLVLKIYVLATVLNLGLDWWLVSRFGLSGAVAGLAVAKMFLVVAMSVAAARRIGGISVPVSTIVKAAVASSGALVWWVIDPGVSGARGVALGAVFSVAIILALYRAFRVVTVEDGELLAATGFPGCGLLARVAVRGTSKL
jgi:O-antigen/teichoic acid export membrane protein